MRMILLITLSLPALASASQWVPLGNTPEARVLLDRQSVETSDGKSRAWLKFVYRKAQPAQTISRGKPFDSTTNRYYLDCSAATYQVLDLVVFYRNEQVGDFHQSLNVNDLDAAKPGTGVAFLLKKVCPHPATQNAAPAQ